MDPEATVARLVQLSAAVVTETGGTTASLSLPRPKPGSSTGQREEDRPSQRDAPVACAAAPVQLPAAMGFVHAPVMSCLPGLTLPGFGGSNANPRLPGHVDFNPQQVAPLQTLLTAASQSARIAGVAAANPLQVLPALSAAGAPCVGGASNGSAPANRSVNKFAIGPDRGSTEGEGAEGRDKGEDDEDVQDAGSERLEQLAIEHEQLKRRLVESEGELERLREVVRISLLDKNRAEMQSEAADSQSMGSSGSDCGASGLRGGRAHSETREGTSRYWLPEEHERFLEALKMHGPKNMKAISDHVSTRTPVQVRTHAQKYFQKMARISASGTPGSKVSKGVAAGRRDADDVLEECVGFASGDSTDSSAAKACNVTRDTDEDSGQVASNRVASRQIASDGEGSR